MFRFQHDSISVYDILASEKVSWMRRIGLREVCDLDAELISRLSLMDFGCG